MQYFCATIYIYTTWCEAYSFMADGYRIFNVRTHLDIPPTHHYNILNGITTSKNETNTNHTYFKSSRYRSYNKRADNAIFERTPNELWETQVRGGGGRRGKKMKKWKEKQIGAEPGLGLEEGSADEGGVEEMWHRQGLAYPSIGGAFFTGGRALA